MIEGSERHKCQLGFELQSLRVFKKRSKELCHKYIALVGKFCTEIITQRLNPYTVELRKYQTNFIIRGALTVIIYYLFIGYCRHSIELEKIDPNFQVSIPV